MTSKELIERRLTSQLLQDHSFHTPEQIVSWFGAIQSQDYAGAVWAISQRLPTTSNDEIESAFNKGLILRTHVMRPTWHFVAPQDIRWMLALTKDRVIRTMSTYNTSLGLTDALFEKSLSIIQSELTGHNYLTRNELGVLLKRNGISWQGNGLAHLVMYVEGNGIICSGPKKGKQHTYALLSERVPEVKQISRDKALKELTKKYFQSHGPAQISDFVWWSGLLTSDAKKGITLLNDLRSDVVDGKIYYYFDTPFHKRTKKICLLPNYDEYTVAYTDREVLTMNVDKSKLGFRQNSLFNNVILIDGKIEGLWRRTIKTKSVHVETRLFKILSSDEKRELSTSLEEYADFLRLTLTSVKKDGRSRPY